MAEYRDTSSNTTCVENKSNAGMIIGGVILLLAIIVKLLFATGFWSANVKSGAMANIDVSAEGRAVPAVDVKSN